MTTSKNDITGDDIKSKSNSDSYRDNYDAIFRKPTIFVNEKPVILSQQQQAAVDDTAGFEET
jgi:hypothetical protein